MSGLKRLSLLVVFVLDWRVRAEVIVAEKDRTQITRAGATLTLDRRGILERRAGEWRLVRGTLLVTSEHKISLGTPFARVSCEDHCTALLRRDEDGLEISSLGGDWTYRPTGDQTLYGVPEASQVRVGLVGPDGRAETEFPQSLPWGPTARAWAHLFSGTPGDFKTQLEAFRGRWAVAVERTSGVQEARAKRNLAGHAERLAGEARRNARAAAADAKLRAEFRARLFDP